MKIGLLINPWAGVGGSVALKGSDGSEMRNQALSLGAIPQATHKAKLALISLQENLNEPNDLTWFCGPDSLGESLLRELDFKSINVLAMEVPQQTESIHSKKLLTLFLDEAKVDLILFVGGDGTARDVFDITADTVPVIGVPAGVKIHSGVFAVTPSCAGQVLAGLMNGDITELRLQEVRDIDEQAFRNNKVRSRYYGEMRVPVSGSFMQHTKVGGIENDDLVLEEIADWFIDNMEADVCYLMAGGNSIGTIMAKLELQNTLLGVDAVCNGVLVKSDCTEHEILDLLAQYSCKVIVSIIGGQGHILGRGNAQISAAVLRTVGKGNIVVIGSKKKLRALQGRSLIVDSADPELDAQWSGLITVVAGYDDLVVYPLGY